MNKDKSWFIQVAKRGFGRKKGPETSPLWRCLCFDLSKERVSALYRNKRKLTQRSSITGVSFITKTRFCGCSNTNRQRNPLLFVKILIQGTAELIHIARKSPRDVVFHLDLVYHLAAAAYLAGLPLPRRVSDARRTPAFCPPLLASGASCDRRAQALAASGNGRRVQESIKLYSLTTRPGEALSWPRLDRVGSLPL
ncbi:hypothetical protein RRG08_065804 [Elysia crispata]|uniref:Uncharacterized protein n=1 Tax=Elysia crispata TaxID=231223 RepID=A0AAE0ZRJ8_9GAST|nr:hypothetical protein RRG08_065804 [Elysia crispata]